MEQESCDSGNTACERRQRQGLHSECKSSKRAMVAAATALLCLSSSPQSALARNHIPGEQQQRATNRYKNLSGGFLSPRAAASSSHLSKPAFVSPPSTAVEETAATSSSSARRFSGSDDDYSSSSSSPYNNNTTALDSSSTIAQETRVTTTSFFRLPSETVGQQMPQELERRAPPREAIVSEPTTALSPKKQPLTQAQIETNFVASLMGLAGFVEGYCIRRHGSFPNLMTGTLLKVSESIGTWNLNAAAFHASMVGSYIGGGWIFSEWKRRSSTTSIGKDEQKKASLMAISVWAGLFLLASDFAVGLRLPLCKLPLLAAGFGVINAGTVDVGAGVTYAMTGHVTKFAQALATPGSLNKPSDPSVKPTVHRSSAVGLTVFFAAAMVANGVCGVLEYNQGLTSPLLGVAQRMLDKIPLGGTMLLAYAYLFRWYLGASERAAAAASSTKMQ